ncbi:hypothetical protein [Bradyrhizobium sp. Arg816]|uniref:hypothetical protein n=1 Tax=Bradyrhizobium sp. Arg816 TaxID=2998491 RepID=UPI00249D9844|nr:hypothetical protein [Bradyrhizobium sp. Arg816]MDI3563939.1 hypothetical protein [Bradyrhizobium sp. Arg816]
MVRESGSTEWREQPFVSGQSGTMVDLEKPSPVRLKLGPNIILLLHAAACCVSLWLASEIYGNFDIRFDERLFSNGVIAVIFVAAVIPVFACTEFSFGYFISFYFYTVVLGFAWLSHFSALEYDHDDARVSALASLIAFMLPAMALRRPFKQYYVLSQKSLGRLLSVIVATAICTIVYCATYGFEFVGIRDIYKYRQTLHYPPAVSYLIGNLTGTLIPFAFACFYQRRQWWMVALILVVAVSFFPITFNKQTLLTPAWLILVAALSALLEVRTAVVASVLVPMAAGGLMYFWFDGDIVTTIFGTINFRMIAIPSVAMDVYNHYFSNHQPTYFCQQWIVQSIFDCGSHRPLDAIFADVYHLGNFNASLLATEGIASVGTYLAPLSTLLCGFVVAVGNMASAGLPHRFLLLSSALVAQTIINVPLSTEILSNGIGLLFLLWYAMPRGFASADAAG